MQNTTASPDTDTGNETHYTAFRCPLDLFEKAKIKAKADRRSLASYLIKLLDVDTKDVTLPPATPAKKSKS